MYGVNDQVSSGKDVSCGMEWSVICLAPVFFIGLRAASGQFVSPGVAGNLSRDIGLENDGGNAVLLVDGPVSELGDLHVL